MVARFSPLGGAKAASVLPSERRQRFPRSKKLRRRAEFQRVYSQGVRVAGRHVVLFAIKTDETGRFGVTASRKIGNAVTRTRAKRRLRELYRRQQTPAMTESLDLVVNARRSCVWAPWEVLVEDFDSCLGRISRRMKAERH